MNNRTTADLRFRPGTPKDQVRIRELILSGLGDHFAQIDPALNPDLDDVTASYTEEGHSLVVGEIDGIIVASGALVTLQDNIGRIARVSVSKGHRRKGIGRAVVTHLMSLAYEQGFRKLLAETNHDWTGAIALYESCGFEEYDRDEESVHLQLDLPIGT